MLTEKPPTLGRIDGKRAGDQIQEFLRELAKYVRLHVREGVQIPHLKQLMEQEDVEMLRIVLTGLFEEDERALHPDDYRILESAEEDEPDDAEAVASRRRAARAAQRGEIIPLSAPLSAAEGTAEGEVSEARAAAPPPLGPPRRRKLRRGLMIAERHLNRLYFRRRVFYLGYDCCTALKISSRPTRY